MLFGADRSSRLASRFLEGFARIGFQFDLWPVHQALPGEGDAISSRPAPGSSDEVFPVRLATLQSPVRVRIRVHVRVRVRVRVCVRVRESVRVLVRARANALALADARARVCVSFVT